MTRRLLLIIVLGALAFSTNAWSRATSPEAQVVIAYISTLRCQSQHPKLKRELAAAFAGWKRRNRKYVVSAQKMVSFKAIAGRYKSLKRKDKRFSYGVCKGFILRLRDPANDVVKHHR